MNREIKFRVWCKQTSEMLSWENIWYSICRVPPNTLPNQTEIIETSFIGVALISPLYEVMQFTGLKDKNGKEIYEGDIVEWDSQGYEGIIREIISFERGSFLIGKITFIDHRTDFPLEIIGNIFENTELLKKYE